MSDVLILNAAYQPTGLATWQDVMTKLHADKAEERVEIVSAYVDRFIRSAHAEHPMPSVVRHVKFTRHKSKGIKFSRANVWARDHGRCQYCNMQVPLESMTYDHVHPKSRGGKTTFDNIVTCCSSCNGRKSGRTPTEAKMKLLKLPLKPTHLPAEFKRGLRWNKSMPSDWRSWFVGEQYWHGDKEESDAEA